MSEPTASSSASRSAFVRIDVRAPDAAAAEWAAAEAFAAGAAGSEEREVSGAKLVLLYCPRARRAAVRGALEALSVPGLAIVGEVAVVERDWAEDWKAGLEAIEIAPGLRVRPSFVEAPPLAPGQAELVVDPAQAFGTGAHESTRLALECLAALAPLAPAARVLDVGTGTGVLALAALRLGAGAAVAHDLDPLAGVAARGNAAHNGLQPQLYVFTGPLAALAPGAFELVVANLLLSELAARCAPGGRVVLSGLLVEQRERVVSGLAAGGLAIASERTRRDASGAAWLGLVATRPGAP